MREEDIQRYGRQILLRELGGRGQRKLMDARVEVHGEGAAIDSAVTYLRAGGTSPLPPAGEGQGEGRIILLSALTPTLSRERERGNATVVLGNGVVWKTADACPECFEKTRALLRSATSAPVVLGSLAALTVQRLVLGWAEPLGAVLWDGNRLVPHAPKRCSAHSST